MRRSSLPTGSAFGVRAMLGVGLLLVVSSSPAQTLAASEARAFFDAVEVPLVNIDVTVTDADGRVVTDLALADFELLEDGRRVEITHFAAALPPAVDPTILEAPPGLVAPKDQQLFFVIFFDERGMAPRQRRAAIDHLRNVLSRQLPPSLQLMLVTSEGRATVRTPFTDDPLRLVATLDEMARDSRSHHDRERERILRDLLSTAGAMGSAWSSQPIAIDPANAMAPGGGRGGSQKTPQQMKIEELAREASRYLPTIRAHAATQWQWAEGLLGDLEILVRSLAVVPGRKAVLLIGGGLEARPGEGLFLAWEQAFPEVARQLHVTAAEEARRFDLGPRTQDLTRSANRHGVSFTTLSVPVGATSGISAEGVGISGDRNLTRSVPGQDALIAIARATGGRSLRSSSGLADRLENAVREMASFYSLGFSPGHIADGLYHELTVRVRRAGFSVRHPEGYLLKTSDDRLAERTLAAAMLGVADNPLDVSLEMQEMGPPQADGGQLVPVQVKLPIAGLMLRPDGDRHSGQITALVVVHGADGLSEPQSWRYPITVPNDQMMEARAGQAGLMLHLVMGKGRQLIAVGVRDDVAGTEATATLEIDLPPQPPKDVQDDAT